ncbi:hypothetical protein V8G54_002808 [Vigna mungo]|uniref:Uncharacterized protein n=1 Tax=Vigna mungo TaxID=3915 RepID=A0AAQ3S9K2_VIGMU
MMIRLTSPTTKFTINNKQIHSLFSTNFSHQKPTYSSNNSLKNHPRQLHKIFSLDVAFITENLSCRASKHFENENTSKHRVQSFFAYRSKPFPFLYTETLLDRVLFSFLFFWFKFVTLLG